MTAELLTSIGGISAFLLAAYWVRSRDLREKYALGWLAVALLLLVCGLCPGLLMAWANAAHLSYPSAVLFVTLGVIFTFAFSVSVSLTHGHRRNARLMQEVAILEHRVRVLEQALAADRDRPPVLAPGAGAGEEPSVAGTPS